MPFKTVFNKIITRTSIWNLIKKCFLIKFEFFSNRSCDGTVLAGGRAWDKERNNLMAKKIAIRRKNDFGASETKFWTNFDVLDHFFHEIVLQRQPSWELRSRDARRHNLLRWQYRRSWGSGPRTNLKFTKLKHLTTTKEVEASFLHSRSRQSAGTFPALCRRSAVSKLFFTMWSRQEKRASYITLVGGSVFQK